MDPTVTVYSETNAGPIGFALDRLIDSLQEAGAAVETRGLDEFTGGGSATEIVLSRAAELSGAAGLEADAKAIDEQGFAVGSPRNSTYVIGGGGATGTMYGGLEAAERIDLGWELDDGREFRGSPAVENRGIKLNVPLDARTPGFDDTGDAAYYNLPEMWNFGFWRRLLDEMAQHRYNTLSLWNKHPFPSLVEVPEYPDVALDDVYAPTAPRDRSISPCETTGPLGPVEKVDELTIEEKIEFWRRVLRHANDRGIDVYLITWNVCVDGIGGKYGITSEQDNETTIDYLRRSVRETILTYPGLAGIGTTAGENMQDRDDGYDREEWLWKTYGRGVRDAKEVNPDRSVRFVHRVWESELETVEREFLSKYPDPLDASFKYARAHVYSSTDPPFADDLLPSLEATEVNCWWTLRNDDIFCFRWGDPDFVSDYVKNLPEDVTAGYVLGSDGYVWGRTFSDLAGPIDRLEIEKHWFAYLLWGRLGYDPDRGRDFFVGKLARRFPEAEAEALLDAWAAASRVIPRVTRFHWRDWDFQWAPEGCMDREGFHTVRDFIETDPMDGSRMQSIREYALETDREGSSPIAVADALDRNADEALAAVGRSARSVENAASRELRGTLDDIRAMAYLGRYYAAKIRGATALYLYEVRGDRRERERAIAALQRAVTHWEDYANVASRNYRPQLLARTQWLNWWARFEDVRDDVRIAREAGGNDY